MFLKITFVFSAIFLSSCAPMLNRVYDSTECDTSLLDYDPLSVKYYLKNDTRVFNKKHPEKYIDFPQGIYYPRFESNSCENVVYASTKNTALGGYSKLDTFAIGKGKQFGGFFINPSNPEKAVKVWCYINGHGSCVFTPLNPGDIDLKLLKK